MLTGCIRSLCCLVLLVLGLVPSAPASAQSSLALVRAQAVEVAAAHAELDAAWASYVASALVVGAGGSLLLEGLIELSSRPVAAAGAPDPDGERALAFFVTGLVATPLGAILFGIAVGLTVDGCAHRDALRARGLRVDLGPGLLGLSVTVPLEG